MIYAFNDIRIDTETYRLWVAGEETPVEPQVFNLVVYLIQNRDKVVTREELLDHVWKGRVVSDISINNNIKSARKVLGDDGTKQCVIKTIHSRGYQFIAVYSENQPEPSVLTNLAGVKTPLEAPTSAKPSSMLQKAKEILPTNKSALIFTTFLLAITLLTLLWRSTQTSSTRVKDVEAAPLVNNQFDTQQLIAVLPFTNAKRDIESDYLSFALASQVIGDLGYLEKYTLLPTGSISKYTNQVSDPIAIARELNADYVISGNYVSESNTVRLNIEFVEVGNNRLIWRESMQVDYANTFTLQDIVAQKVAKGLGVGFRQNDANQPHRDTPNSALAFEYYLRGISYPKSNDGHKMAIEMLKKSIQLDPQYAPSYAHLGFHRRLLEQHGRVAPTGLKDAEWYYLKALKLNPRLLLALSNLSALYTETNRIEEAMLITRKMLDINPDDADAHFALSYIYRYAGLLDESIEEAETALTISPDNSRFRSIIATYVSAGQFDNALKKVYLDKGDYGIGYSGIIAFKQEKLDLAKKLFRQVIKIDSTGIWGLIAKFHLAVLDGNPQLGLQILTKIVDTDIVDAENMYYFAEFYALVNDHEACLEMLERAVNSGYFNYPNISSNPSFRFIKNDIRYSEILLKAKQRHDAFKANFQ